MSQLENFPILIAESLNFCWPTYKSKVSINYRTRNAIGSRSSPVKFNLIKQSAFTLLLQPKNPEIKEQYSSKTIICGILWSRYSVAPPISNDNFLTSELHPHY